MKRVLIDIIISQKERFVTSLKSRHVIIYPNKSKVQTIVGPRRAGKSSLLKLTIDKLLMGTSYLFGKQAVVRP